MVAAYPALPYNQRVCIIRFVLFSSFGHSPLDRRLADGADARRGTPPTNRLPDGRMAPSGDHVVQRWRPTAGRRDASDDLSERESLHRRSDERGQGSRGVRRSEQRRDSWVDRCQRHRRMSVE